LKGVDGLPTQCLSVLPFLLSSSSLRVQSFGLHVLASLHQVTMSGSLHSERASVAHGVMKRLRGGSGGVDGSEEKEGHNGEDEEENMRLELVRRSVGPMLVLAKRYHKYEQRLLTLILTAKGWEGKDGQEEESRVEGVQSEDNGERKEMEVETSSTEEKVDSRHGDDGSEPSSKRLKQSAVPVVDLIDTVDLVVDE
jgi:hypothetical protein